MSYQPYTRQEMTGINQVGDRRLDIHNLKKTLSVLYNMRIPCVNVLLS